MKGRPRILKEGRRVLVYLDAETHAKAKAIGGGNASRGIRKAIKQAK
jgi:hypothetical protein